MKDSEIRDQLKVSSVHFLSSRGMARALGISEQQMRQSHCTGCLDYNNPFDMRPYDKDFKRTTYLKKGKYSHTPSQIQTQII